MVAIFTLGRLSICVIYRPGIAFMRRLWNLKNDVVILFHYLRGILRVNFNSIPRNVIEINFKIDFEIVKLGFSL